MQAIEHFPAPTFAELVRFPGVRVGSHYRDILQLHWIFVSDNFKSTCLSDFPNAPSCNAQPKDLPDAWNPSGELLHSAYFRRLHSLVSLNQSNLPPILCAETLTSALTRHGSTLSGSTLEDFWLE